MKACQPDGCNKSWWSAGFQSRAWIWRHVACILTGWGGSFGGEHVQSLQPRAIYDAVCAVEARV
jgi:hypothetical protein